MKKLLKYLLLLSMIFSTQLLHAQKALIDKTAYIKFHSDKGGIYAENFSVISKLNPQTGSLVFSVAIQSFEFKNALMQRDFNKENVMNSAVYPKAKFNGKITNIESVDFDTPGSYPVIVSGVLTIKGISRQVETPGTIIIEQGMIKATASFSLDRFEYGVSGKTKSISQILDIHVEAEYE